MFRLVIDTVTPLNKDRKCYRMIGGVLAEKTVEDVLPSLKTNLEGVSLRNQLYPPKLTRNLDSNHDKSIIKNIPS
jgi:chaperonin cofactor prefoldin